MTAAKEASMGDASQFSTNYHASSDDLPDYLPLLNKVIGKISTGRTKEAIRLWQMILEHRSSVLSSVLDGVSFKAFRRRDLRSNPQPKAQTSCHTTALSFLESLKDTCSRQLGIAYVQRFFVEEDLENHVEAWNCLEAAFRLDSMTDCLKSPVDRLRYSPQPMRLRCEDHRYRTALGTSAALLHLVAESDSDERSQIQGCGLPSAHDTESHLDFVAAAEKAAASTLPPFPIWFVDDLCDTLVTSSDEGDRLREKFIAWVTKTLVPSVDYVCYRVLSTTNIQSENQAELLKLLLVALAKCLKTATDSCAKELGKINNCLISAYDGLNSPEEASRYLCNILSLQELTGCLDTAETKRLSSTILSSQTKERYAGIVQSITEDDLEIVGPIGELLAYPASFWNLKAALREFPLDTASCLRYSSELALLFIKGSPEEQRRIRKCVAQANSYISITQVPEDFEQRLDLTLSRLHLIESLLTEIGLSDFRRFYYLYEFFQLVRSRAELLREPEMIDSFRATILDLRLLAMSLLSSEEMITKIESNEQRKAEFYFRFGEICLAHKTHNCVAALELPSIVGQALGAFEKVLTFAWKKDHLLAELAIAKCKLHLTENGSIGSQAGGIPLETLVAIDSMKEEIERALDHHAIGATRCLVITKDLVRAYDSLEEDRKLRLKHMLITLFRRVQRKRAGLGTGDKDREDQKSLSYAMLCLNEALRNGPVVSLLTQFDDLYEFHECLRFDRTIYLEPTMLKNIRLAMLEAKSIGERLLNTEDFLNLLEAQPRLKASFYSRLGEICRAHLQYECVPPSALYQILDDGVRAFQTALSVNNPPSPRHLNHNCPRMAECIRYAGHYEEAIATYERVAVPSALGIKKTTSWEARVNIAQCYQQLAKFERQEGRELESGNYFASAEHWYQQAARIWEKDSSLLETVCGDNRNALLHGFLAWMYFEWVDYEQAERQARLFESIASRIPRVFKDFHDRNQFVLGTALMRQRKNSEAIECFEKLSSADMAQEHKLKPLVALLYLYRYEGNLTGLSTASSRLIEAAKEIGIQDILALTDEQQLLLIEQSEMEEYVRKCETHLEKGEVRTLLRELPQLISASRALHVFNRPDALLQGLLARAYRQIGKYESAFSTLHNALASNVNPKTQGIIWLEIGKTYLGQRKYVDAATAFEKAYAVGEHNLGAIIMAARANRLAGNYEKALDSLDLILNSGLNKAPKRTMIELAWTYWKRYCDPRTGVGGNEEDVVQAGKHVKGVLENSIRAFYPAADLLAEMADHHIARTVIHELLENRNPIVLESLISALSRCRKYDEELAYRAIHTISESDNPDSALCKAVNAYVIGAWTYSYTTQSRESFQLFLRGTVRELFRRTASTESWGRLLASNKGAIRNQILNRVRTEMSSILMVPPGTPPQNVIAHLRNTALPELLDILGTRLIGMIPAAYTGREPGSPLLTELREVLDSWGIRRELSGKIDTVLRIPIDEQESYYVTEFQRTIAFSFVNQFYQQLSDDDFVGRDKLDKVAIRVERQGGRICLKVRVSLVTDIDSDEFTALGEGIESSAFLKKWKKATAYLLPQTVSLESRFDRKDLVVTMYLWRSARLEREKWKWNHFYSYVVGQAGDERLRKNYYFQAVKRIHKASPLTAEDLWNYVYTQLDGVFVRAYDSALQVLQSIPHTIKNTLKHLPIAEAGDHDALRKSASEIQQLNRFLLDIGPPRLRDFDLGATLDDFESECRAFYPDMVFEFSRVSADSAIVVSGSKEHILVALRDIIHNSVDAMRKSASSSERRVNIAMIQLEDGVQILVANAYAGSSLSSEGGFGIGGQTVEWIICDIHHGRVSHGPVEDDLPMRYEWRLFLPEDPFSQEE